MSRNRPSPLHAALLLALAALGAGCSESTGEAGASPAAAAVTGGLTFIEPEDPAQPDLYDLGHADVGAAMGKTVRMRNDDGRPLLIRSVRPGCSCTLPKISYVDAEGRRVQGNTRSDTEVLSLPPGAVAELELGIETRNAPVFNRHRIVIVRITTDSETNPYTTVQLRMMVRRPFSAAPPVIELQQIAANGFAEGKSDLIAMTEVGARLVDVLEAPEGVEATLELKNVFGTEVWELRARLVPPHPLGLLERTILLRTTGPGGEGEGQPFEMKVRAVAVPDVQLEPALLLLQARGSELATASAQLVARLSGQRVRIEESRVEGEFSEQLRVVPVPQAPDEHGRAAVWDVRIVADAELPQQAFSGKLVLALDDPQYPRVEVGYVHRPRPQSP